MSKDSAVTVEHDALVLGTVRVSFQRTLRIPERGLHDLPPGLGAFPIRRVEDYPDTVPARSTARSTFSTASHGSTTTTPTAKTSLPARL